jgi:hypothetical protein
MYIAARCTYLHDVAELKVLLLKALAKAPFEVPVHNG